MDVFVKPPWHRHRAAILLPGGGEERSPALVIPIGRKGLEHKKLIDLCMGYYGKRKLSEEEIIQIIEKAEVDYEQRLKVQQATIEIYRRMEGQIKRLKTKKHRWEELGTTEHGEDMSKRLVIARR